MKWAMALAVLFFGAEAGRFSPTEALADTPPAAAPATHPDAAARKIEIEKDSEYFRNLESQIEAELTELQAKIRRLEMEVGESTVLIDPSPESLQLEAAKVDDQALTTALAYDAASARVTAITHQIEEMQKKAASALNDAPVLAEMQKIVDVRQNVVDRDTKMVDAATMSRSDLDQAVAELAEAKTQLLLERDRVSAAAGGDVITALQKELSDATIDEEALTAQQNHLKKVREALIRLVPLCNDLTELRADAKEKREVLGHLQDKLDEMTLREEMNLPEGK